MINYGWYWEKRLRELWNDQNLSLVSIGTILHVERHTIQIEAQKLGLPSTGNHRIPSSISRISRFDGINDSNGLEKKRQYYRQRWEKAMENNPGVGVNDLCKQENYSHVTDWLRSNDPDWYALHKPQKKLFFGERKDWGSYDIDLSSKIPFVANSIRDEPGFPIRITRVAICKKFGIRDLQPYQLEKLPLVH